jgi:hypothetical protein
VPVDGKRHLEIREEIGLCNEYRLRDDINIMYFIDLERSMPTWPWAFKQQRRTEGFNL